MIVDIHIPLVMDTFSPSTASNMIYILEKLDVAANYPIEQTSSGFEHFQNGYLDDAKKIGEKFIKEFTNDRPVIIPSAQHAAFIKNEYSKLFKNTAYHNEYKQLQKTVFEFTDYVVNQENYKNLNLSHSAIVGVHHGCADRKYGTAHNLKTLLEHIEGTKIIELNKSHECCGNGGGLSFRNPETALEMGAYVMQGEVPVDYLISTEIDCLKHLEASNEGISTKFIHIIDYLILAMKQN
jgi:L-lactate dehydrogenase complex protein LldE